MSQRAGVGDFVDPRSNPSPPAARRALSTTDHEEVAPLVRLCREARIYGVEAWIRDGKPLFVADVPRGQKYKSALRVAVESRQFDLALLLLANGFPPDPPGERLLQYALNERMFAFLDLLLAWGANPLAIEPVDVLDTYDTGLYDRFTTLGLDLTHDHALAWELSRRSSNRPAYGWAKRRAGDPRIARELSVALCDAVDGDHERAVALLLWAGADAHMKVPMLRYFKHGEPEDPECDMSAVEVAIRRGQGKYLRQLKPNPELDDLEALWPSVRDIETLDALVKISPPTDWSRTIVHLIHELTYGFHTPYSPRATLERMFTAYGARLTELDGDHIAGLRRAILKQESDTDLMPVLRFLARPEYCDPSIFEELMRTGAMRKRFGGGLNGVTAPTTPEPRPSRRGRR